MKKTIRILGVVALMIAGNAYGKYQQVTKTAGLITATHTNKSKGNAYFLTGKALAAVASKLQHTDPKQARRVAHKAVTAFDKAIRKRKNSEADELAVTWRKQTWAFIKAL